MKFKLTPFVRFCLAIATLLTSFAAALFSQLNKLINDRFVLAIKTTGRWKCELKYVHTGEKSNVTGNCDGRSINENHNDDDQDKHKAPITGKIRKVTSL